MKKIVMLFIAILLTGSVSTLEAQKGKSYRAKTVRVKSYTTKKGKHVKSYKRSKPSHKNSTYHMPFVRREELVA